MSAIYGIAGKSQRAAPIHRHLDGMSAALRHRGPDDESRWVDASGSVALGFRYLRTSSRESSPGIISNEDGTLLMVCDGHVFNTLTLQSILSDRGHTLASGHSCEVLMHLYEDEGVAGWRHVDGQFALAVWDLRQKCLVLGRDVFGVRPLYYWSGLEGVVFGSEIKALLRHDHVPRAVDETALADFLTFTSVPGPRTLFRDVRRVQPGGAAICGMDGTVRHTCYWDLLHDPVAESTDERFYVERVRTLHHAAVAGRDVDGPIGSLLSGGNDSSANAALLARMPSRTLHTFTVGLADHEGDAKYNDLEYARKVSRSIGSVHHERLLTSDEFLQTIPRTIDAMDDLVSEPSSVFLHHALRLAADEGLRVVLTGEANDELSAGHNGMLQIRDGYYRRWRPYLRQPAWMRRGLASVGAVLSPSRRDILLRAAEGDEYFWSYETAWMDSHKAVVLAPDVLARTRRAGRIPAAVRMRFDSTPHRGRDYLAYVVYTMMQDFYFSNLMLGKLDLLAASLGVEPRCPYTAPEYAHFVFNIPAAFKARNGLVKYAFKKSVEGLLDHEVVYRPKQGFRTPVVELFRGALGRWAEPVLLESGLTRQGLLRREHLADILHRHRAGERDYSNRLWAAMSLNLWSERWMTP